MVSVSAWIESFRLHTLPLSLSTIIMGSALASYHHEFSSSVFIWAFVTTIFLQTVSNLANDYGDAEKGVDNENRIGPKRGLQAGAIAKKQMRNAIIIFVLLSLVSGIILIAVGMKRVKISYGIILFLVGIAAIIAALKYTVGKNPYGYQGLGDLFVFIFFGLVGVMGTFYLHTHSLSLLEFLPAISMGCFSTGVLNLNNLRDRENDAKHGKHTLVVKLGLQRAKYYHAILLGVGMLVTIAYMIMIDAAFWKWISLLSFTGIIKSIVVVQKNTIPQELYPELKRLSLSTLAFAVLFWVGVSL